MAEGSLLLLELVLMFFLLKAIWRPSTTTEKRDLGFFAFHETVEPEQTDKSDKKAKNKGKA